MKTQKVTYNLTTSQKQITNYQVVNTLFQNNQI